MKGIKKYTHKDREKVIKELTPLIKKKLGDNLIALAAQASFARGEDSDYSDLELIAFVKKMSRGKEWEGMGKIRDGMLVEIVWMTKEVYVKNTLEVTDDWYIAGSDRLLPIINKRFIDSINKYKVENLKAKCLNSAAKLWHDSQEATCKVLNAVVQKNKLGISLLFFDMYWQMLRTLSLFNQRPFITFAKMIKESFSFELKPKDFDKLTDIMVKGSYNNLKNLNKVVRSVFKEFEKMFEQAGYDLYDDNIDPNKPMKKFDK